jgi:hypothetical protein
VYVGSYDGKVYALDGASGAKQWEFTTGYYVRSSPAIGADGTVYVGSLDGKVYAIRGAAPLSQTAWPKFHANNRNTGGAPGAPPFIDRQPADQTALAGGTASFTVSATGTGRLAYQWRKDGVPLADGGRLSGTASPTLGISDVVSVDAGIYSVRVSNGGGPTNSTGAVLTVVTFDLGVAATHSTSSAWVPGSWFVQTAVSHDGVAAAQSGPIADS